jgi:hypothetical protein
MKPGIYVVDDTRMGIPEGKKCNPLGHVTIMPNGGVCVQNPDGDGHAMLPAPGDCPGSVDDEEGGFLKLMDPHGIVLFRRFTLEDYEALQEEASLPDSSDLGEAATLVMNWFFTDGH